MLNQFKNLISFQQLYDTEFYNIPDKKGVYIVKKPKEMYIEFSLDTTAIKEFKNKNMIYNPDILRSKFENSDREILYIGKAGGHNNKLKQRIKQFIRYGYGEVDNHRGGRTIWQIVNNKTLLLGFMECDNPEEIEKELLKKYEIDYDVLPLGNWKKG